MSTRIVYTAFACIMLSHIPTASADWHSVDFWLQEKKVRSPRHQREIPRHLISLLLHKKSTKALPHVISRLKKKKILHLGMNP